MELTIYELILKCKNKNHIELLEFLDLESINKEGQMLKSKDYSQKEKLKSYINYVKGFLFFLNTGEIPYSIEKSDFNLLKPIIIELVKNGMNKSALEKFN